jgi:hypothetical protein
VCYFQKFQQSDLWERNKLFHWGKKEPFGNIHFFEYAVEYAVEYKKVIQVFVGDGRFITADYLLPLL